MVIFLQVGCFYNYSGLNHYYKLMLIILVKLQSQFIFIPPGQLLKLKYIISLSMIKKIVLFVIMKFLIFIKNNVLKIFVKTLILNYLKLLKVLLNVIFAK